MQSFCATSLKDLQQWMVNLGERAYHAIQVFDWVYKKKVLHFDKMSNLKKSVRDCLQESFILPTLKQRGHLSSEDQDTEKFLWELSDQKLVESVWIEAPNRGTVCVSSQVGCPARCAFCASGKGGFVRNLTSSEIIEQVLLMPKKATHVVFMGMGEPLENYDEVIQAIQAFTDPERMGISSRRVTVSTVGVIPNIRKLANDCKVNLALSLHAPTQEIRKKIIPYARKYELLDILLAMEEYACKTKRDITFEYTLIAGINDRKEDAELLADLLKDKQCTVNLIPYNPIDGVKLQRPSKETIQAFRQILLKSKIPTTWRYTKGKDIAAACGQLALQVF